MGAYPTAHEHGGALTVEKENKVVPPPSRFAASKMFQGKAKRILAMGLTGVGKSTIVNMLANNSAHADGMDKPAETGDKMAGVTSLFTSYFGTHGLTEVYIDSIGFGDHRFDRISIKKFLKQLTRQCRVPFDCVLVVLRFGRLSDAARRDIQFLDVLFENSWKKNSVLVFTYSPRDMTREKWIEKNSQQSKNFNESKSRGNDHADDPILPLLQSLKHVVFVNNDIDAREEVDKLNYKDRARGLSELRAAINLCNGANVISKLSLREWIMNVFNYLFIQAPADVVAQGKAIVKMLEEFSGDWLHQNNFGPCNICEEVIVAQEFEGVAITPCCHYPLHDTCLSDWLAKKNICPLCSSLREFQSPSQVAINSNHNTAADIQV
eukprot:gb/GEZN01009000.1/.p1 GENE.gb/GEZN01009000.1/~~gb/GEZN01009000.1/.p1  ORF type:complete len:379 (+),score=27.28 gb/GEZN01009000.1/:112-1248(+)